MNNAVTFIISGLTMKIYQSDPSPAWIHLEISYGEKKLWNHLFYPDTFLMVLRSLHNWADLYMKDVDGRPQGSAEK